MQTKNIFMIGALVFVLATIGFLIYGGVFSSKNLAAIKDHFFSKPEEQVVRENVAPALVVELEKLKGELKQREEELDQKREVINSEWDSLQKLKVELDNKLKEVEARLNRLDQAKAVLIKDEADKMRKMDSAQSAKILEDLDNDKAVAILLNMKSTDRAKIFDAMTPSRATVLTKELLEYADM